MSRRDLERSSSSSGRYSRTLPPPGRPPWRRYYAIYKTQNGEPGIYDCFRRYVELVHDARVPYNGEWIVHDPLSRSKSFASLQQAEDAYLRVTGTRAPLYLGA